MSFSENFIWKLYLVKNNFYDFAILKYGKSGFTLI